MKDYIKRLRGRYSIQAKREKDWENYYCQNEIKSFKTELVKVKDGKISSTTHVQLLQWN